MKTFSLLVVFLSPVFSGLYAMFMPPAPVPYEAMAESLQRLQAADPENLELRYRMGRLHYLVYDTGVAVIFTHQPNEPGASLPADFHLKHLLKRIQDQAREKAPGEFLEVEPMPIRGMDRGEPCRVQVLTKAERVDHATKAYALLLSVHDADKANALVALTLGSFIESWLGEPEELREAGADTVLAQLQTSDAAAAYESAWRLSREKDLARPFLPLEGRVGLISSEAAKAWMRLEKPETEAIKVMHAQMEADLESLKSLRHGAVTPLAFYPQDPMEVQVPVDLEAEVSFDLAGDGSGGTWTWVKPGTVMLVWDPEQTGAVRGGDQLFGAYTWQMFWKDGFEALAVLDRNGDGALRGSELQGLAGWSDSEPLGVADPGEVMALSALGVESIRVSSEEYSYSHAAVWNPEGIRLQSGKTLPVWDWMAPPAGSGVR